MAKRRKLPNGTGSIERVKLTPQGKTRLNQYRARLPAKKGRKDIGFFKTYNEAMEALINYQEAPPEVTFKALYEKYKNTNEFKKLSEKTQRRYEVAFDKYKDIHEENIHDIRFSQLQEVIDDMENDGYQVQNQDGSYKQKYYSKSSIERLKHLVSKIYKTAIKENLLTYNLATNLEVGGLKIQRKKQIFTNKEINSLFNSIHANYYARHILILIFTGMRTGEYLGLKKDNINLKDNTIINFGEKTEAGRDRKMFIHPKIKPILAELMLNSQTGYIVEYKQPNGKIINPSINTFNKKMYYPALEKAGVEKKIPYTCRYTFATIAHNSGVTDKALQKLMGHTNFNITANSYIQDLDEYIYSELQKIQ